MESQIIFAVLAGVFILLFLILFLRLQAFISLLIASIVVGLVAGMSPDSLLTSVQEGMGNTLGFVATVVGLGAMFGAILEHTGGARAVADFLLSRMGIRNAQLAMGIAGFLIAIPVFFDVAFIILTPVIYALQRKTGKSLLLYAIPLLAGLAITHAFIPPTPGPVAVADVMDVGLGYVILTGALVGIPTLIVSGLLFGKYISVRIAVKAPNLKSIDEDSSQVPPVKRILLIIFIPIVLILVQTFMKSGILDFEGVIIGYRHFAFELTNLVTLIGHPFSALIIANLFAWYLLGRKQGLSGEKLFEITTKSMAPAGTIILLTGAGGAFKQVLVDTSAGNMIADLLTDTGIPLILFSFAVAALVRVIQGSATVAMLTAAGIVAPLVDTATGQFAVSCLVISIASGASVLSHVNDSGFWLVGQYLGLSEKQTAASWTVMTTLLAITGFLASWLLMIFFG